MKHTALLFLILLSSACGVDVEPVAGANVEVEKVDVDITNDTQSVVLVSMVRDNVDAIIRRVPIGIGETITLSDVSDLDFMVKVEGITPPGGQVSSFNPETIDGSIYSIVIGFGTDGYSLSADFVE